MILQLAKVYNQNIEDLKRAKYSDIVEYYNLALKFEEKE
jgi:hypothetical protein